MKKRLSFALIAIFLLPLAGCGSGNTTSGVGDSFSSDVGLSSSLVDGDGGNVSDSTLSDDTSGDENPDNADANSTTTTTKEGAGKTNKTSKKSGTTTKASLEIIDKYSSDNLPKKDLKGFTLRVGAHYTAQLDPSTSEKGGYKHDLRQETLNKLQKRFNFKLEVEFIEANKSAETYAARIFSGDTTVPHILMDTTWSSGALIASGLLTDFNTVKYIDMDAPWWNQTIRQSSTIGGKTYLMQSEISEVSVSNVWMLAYNKRIAKEIGLSEDTMNKMVKEKKWTLDKFVYYASLAVKNLDSDPTMTAADRWGFNGAPGDTLFAFMSSAGVDFITNDNGTMRYGLNNANALSVLTELNKVFTGYGIYDMATTNDILINRANFVEGRSLFYAYSSGQLIKAIREMEDDAGLIPLPLYGSQKEYRGRVDTNSSSIVIPKTTTGADLENVGLLLEALSFACWKDTATLIEYYGDNYLDEDAASVLEDAFSWSYVEPANFTGTANFTSSCKSPVYQAIALSATADVSGLLSSIEPPSQAAIDEFFEQ